MLVFNLITNFTFRKGQSFMDTSKLKFISKENPSDKEIDELRKNLRSFNNSFTNQYPYHSLIQQIQDKNGKLLGGVYGTISWGWLYIDLIWVDECLRGSGNGTYLMQTIEEKASKKGVFGYRLSTADFQALDFYKNLNYEVFGEIDDLPPGHTTYFLKKLAR